MLPFEIAVQKFDELPLVDRWFFCERDDRPPPEQDRQQIARMTRKSAQALANLLVNRLPLGHDQLLFPATEKIILNHESWNTESGLSEVRDWLHRRGIPYAREVYLFYDHECIVVLPWKMLLRYWDSFAWCVGYDMVATDDTCSWGCLFHHEDFIEFGSYQV